MVHATNRSANVGSPLIRHYSPLISAVQPEGFPCLPLAAHVLLHGEGVPRGEEGQVGGGEVGGVEGEEVPHSTRLCRTTLHSSVCVCMQ